MANYQFLDANNSVLTAGSSVISGVNYPIVKVPDTITVVGSVTLSGNPSISGTVNVVQSGLNITSVSGTLEINSVVGTYAEDAAHTTGDKGLFVLAVRNDTMPSITSTDGDYSPYAVGPVGEMLTANAPITKWVQGVASCFTGVIQPVIAAQGTSIFTYITSGQATNNSANNAYLTISSGGTTIAYLPVPANSGALPIMPNAWKGLTNAAISASVSGVASVFLSFQGFISKT